MAPIPKCTCGHPGAMHRFRYDDPAPRGTPVFGIAPVAYDPKTCTIQSDDGFSLLGEGCDRCICVAYDASIAWLHPRVDLATSAKLRR